MTVTAIFSFLGLWMFYSVLYHWALSRSALRIAFFFDESTDIIMGLGFAATHAWAVNLFVGCHG